MDLCFQVVVVVYIELNKVLILCILRIFLGIDEFHSLERAENALSLMQIIADVVKCTDGSDIL